MTKSTLRLALISRTFYYTPVWAALDQGFFQAEGLEVETSYLGNAPQATVLLDGSADIAIAPPEGIVQNVQAGGPLRIIAGNSGALSHELIVQPDIHSIEELRGRIFGILSPTEGSFFHFQELAEKHGLFYPGGYRVEQTGGAPSRHQALIAREIDAGLQSVPWSFVAEDLGFRRLADISDYIPDWQFNTVNANRQWCDAHPERTRAFLRALLRGVEWVYANRADCTRLASEQMGMEPRYAERAWDYFTANGKVTRDMAVNVPGLRKVIEVQIKAGLLPAGTPTDAAPYCDTSWLATL